ncbi:Chitooligosaccharide deacetylase [Candidatus Magnetaquicoccaceae bacterium FCR-1]|uniref:Chitooligosaccharide deacetylase n=1 Tax=Candidatus Magnetaquiglobus chichijimensis TaxID=3141448 RepID=A0ABQ0C7T5_9PROT
MIKIITTADDYGLTTSMNQAMHDLFEKDALCRASAMATGEALEAGLAQIAPAYRSRLGAHLCLIEEPPVSPPEHIPTLVTDAGRLMPRWGLIRALLLGQIDPEQVAREIRAQMGRLRDLGLSIGHVDSHAHLHVWPTLAPIIRSVCLEFGVSAFRLPIESLSLSWPGALPPGRVPIALAISACARSCRRHYATPPARVTDRFLGLLHSGHMNEQVVESWLIALKRQGNDNLTVEIIFHPAYPEALPKRIRLDPQHGQYDFLAETRALERLPALLAEINAREPGPELRLDLPDTLD